MSINIFPSKTLQELTDCLFWFIQTVKMHQKNYSAFRYYLPKGIIDNYNVIINGKNRL